MLVTTALLIFVSRIRVEKSNQRALPKEDEEYGGKAWNRNDGDVLLVHTPIHLICLPVVWLMLTAYKNLIIAMCRTFHDLVYLTVFGHIEVEQTLQGYAGEGRKGTCYPCPSRMME